MFAKLLLYFFFSNNALKFFITHDQFPQDGSVVMSWLTLGQRLERGKTLPKLNDKGADEKKPESLTEDEVAL